MIADDLPQRSLLRAARLILAQALQVHLASLYFDPTSKGTSSVLHSLNMSCATACLPTHNHPHEPKGTFQTLGPSSFPNVETYVSLPPGLSSLEEAKSKKWNKIILWMADVYGPRYMNNQKVMDLTAAQGYLVVSPDYFQHSKLEDLRDDPSFDFQGWIKSHRQIDPKNGKQYTSNMVFEWVKIMKDMFGAPDAKYGVTSYCFGASYCMELTQSGQVQAAALVHPAYLDDDSQFQNLKAPLFASLAEQDTHFPPARIAALIHQLTAQATPTHPNGDSATDEPCGKGNYEWTLQMFGGVRHGFALRGDMDVERCRWSSGESLEACWRWWKRFLE